MSCNYFDWKVTLNSQSYAEINFPHYQPKFVLALGFYKQFFESADNLVIAKARLRKILLKIMALIRFSLSLPLN